MTERIEVGLFGGVLMIGLPALLIGALLIFGWPVKQHARRRQPPNCKRRNWCNAKPYVLVHAPSVAKRGSMTRWTTHSQRATRRRSWCRAAPIGPA